MKPTRSTIFIAAIFALTAAAFIGNSVAQTGEDLESRSSFGGRPVLVTMKGVRFGVTENARFETVGTNGFIVIEVDPENGPAYEW